MNRISKKLKKKANMNKVANDFYVTLSISDGENTEDFDFPMTDLDEILECFPEGTRLSDLTVINETNDIGNDNVLFEGMDLEEANEYASKIENLHDDEYTSFKYLIEDGEDIDKSLDYVDTNEVQFMPNMDAYDLGENEVDGLGFENIPKYITAMFFDYEAFGEWLINNDNIYCEYENGIIIDYR